MTTIDFALIQWPPRGLTDLVSDAAAEHLDFVRRLVDDFASGANRFDGPGESLLGAFQDGAVVAIGGLNRDPYAGRVDVGRLRHVYVRPAARQRGLARQLVERLLATPHGFAVIRLRTSNPSAARLYERLGFRALAEPDATHAIILG